MAVVEGKSNLVPRSLGGAGGADPQALSGIIRVLTGTVTNAATDSLLSKYRLCDLPSDCYLLPRTLFDVENWGYATINIGTKDDIDALITILKSAGNTVTPVAFGDAKHGKPLWEVLGLAADPGGYIPLYVQGPANAVAAGSMPFQIEYVGRA